MIKISQDTIDSYNILPSVAMLEFQEDQPELYEHLKVFNGEGVISIYAKFWQMIKMELVPLRQGLNRNNRGPGIDFDHLRNIMLVGEYDDET